MTTATSVRANGKPIQTSANVNAISTTPAPPAGSARRVKTYPPE